MDTLSRDDMKPSDPFSRLSERAQKILLKLANTRPGEKKHIPNDIVSEIDSNWIMVPSSRLECLVQIVINSDGYAWRI